MKQFEIVTQPIETEQYRDFTINERQGAVVVFTGHVREWTKGIRTQHLEYEAYIPMAEKKLAQIGKEIEEKWPGTITTIVHRIGPLQISDIAVLIAVSSPHRKAAYAANEYAIERIKEIVPIWKKEIWEDGAEWQGHQKGTYNEAKRESKMKILYFAELKELLNRSTETIHLDTTLTVQEFESYLLKHHSELKSKKFQIAVNEEFVRQDDIVQPGDTIALIPPVSGG